MWSNSTKVGATKVPTLASLRKRDAMAHAANGSHRLDMRLDGIVRLRVDHGPDVGRKVRRIADDQLVHGADQEFDRARRDAVLQVQDAQRRATLARAVERGSDRIDDDLLQAVPSCRQ